MTSLFFAAIITLLYITHEFIILNNDWEYYVDKFGVLFRVFFTISI